MAAKLKNQKSASPRPQNTEAGIDLRVLLKDVEGLIRLQALQSQLLSEIQRQILAHRTRS